MDKLQQQTQEITTITKDNWLSVWQEVPVKAENLQSQVLALKTPQISTINRGEPDREQGIMVFEALIINLCDFFGEKWSPFQIRDCAELFHSEYYWLQIAELKHFVLRAKLGDLRQDIRKFTPAILTDWIADYADKSIQERQDMAIREASQQKQALASGGMTFYVDGQSKEADEAKKLIQQLAEDWKKERNESLKTPIVSDEEIQAKAKKTAEAYAKLMNVDIDEIRKQFKKDAA